MSAYDSLNSFARDMGWVVKYSADGIPSFFYPIYKCKSIDLDPSLPDHTHPAFIVNGVEIPRRLIAVYKASETIANGALHSLPMMPPRVNLSADEFLERIKAAGAGFGPKTVADSGLLLLIAQQDGIAAHGNNYYGVDYRDGSPWELAKSYAIGTKRTFQGIEYTCLVAHTSNWENRPETNPVFWRTGRRIGGMPVASQISNAVPNGYNTLTGSGPISWTHNGTPNGITDVNGNCFDQDWGYRIVGGEIQILSNNDAASPEADLSASSAAWKAILPSAEDDTCTLVAPGTPGTLKWDVQNSAPVLSTTITNRASASAAFSQLTHDSSVPHVPALLMELGIFPTPGSTVQGRVYINNAEGVEFSPRRGGYYNNPSNAGLGYVNVVSSRPGASVYFGARSAFLEELETDT